MVEMIYVSYKADVEVNRSGIDQDVQAVCASDSFATVAVLRLLMNN